MQAHGQVNASLDSPLMGMLNREQLGWYATMGKGHGQPRKPTLGTVDLHDVERMGMQFDCTDGSQAARRKLAEWGRRRLASLGVGIDRTNTHNN